MSIGGTSAVPVGGPEEGGGSPLSLSVVIPTHNRPDLLREAVASALRACPAEAEVVVVDDRSRQPATEVLAGLLASDPRLRVIRSTCPPGAAGARNAGVSVAGAAVVLFLDDDDLMLAGYPQRVLAAAADRSAPAFGFCATTSVDAGMQSATPDKRRQPAGDGMLPLSTPLRRRLIAFSAGFWIRRKLYLDLGGCDTSLTVDEDSEFCCRLAARGLRPWFDAQPGVSLRSAPDNRDRLTRSTPPEVIVACYRHTWERHGDSFPPWSEARWHLATRLIRRAVCEGRPEDARASLATMHPKAFRAALRMFFHIKRLTGARRPG